MLDVGFPSGPGLVFEQGWRDLTDRVTVMHDDEEGWHGRGHKTDADGVRGRDSEKGMRDNDILYNWGVTGVNIWR